MRFLAVAVCDPWQKTRRHTITSHINVGRSPSHVVHCSQT